MPSFLWVCGLACHLHYYTNYLSVTMPSLCILKIHLSEFKHSVSSGLRGNLRMVFTSTLEQFGSLQPHSAQCCTNPV